MDDATGRDTYTAEQRETLESGLRVLARMIARAQLRPEAAATGEGGSDADTSTPGEQHYDSAHRA